MIKKIILSLLVIVVLFSAYLLFWPVPVNPIPFKLSPDPGLTVDYAPNDRLNPIELLGIGNNSGPEAVAIDGNGVIYSGTNEGYIVRLAPGGTNPENWVDTKGRPCGMAFDSIGNLIVADSVQGLLSISPIGKITVLSKEVDGIPVLYADDLDIANDGKIYFSDATTKFSPKEYGALKACFMEIIEHEGHGRLLVYDPADNSTKTLLKGLTFANGVAVSHDQTFVLVNESGSCCITRYWISGPKAGRAEPFIEALPGIPDNISKGDNGIFWVALVGPRGPVIDTQSIFLRKIIFRLLFILEPIVENPPKGSNHIIGFDKNGKVVIDLQNSESNFLNNTSVAESKDYLYLGSYSAPAIGRVSKEKIGF